MLATRRGPNAQQPFDPLHPERQVRRGVHEVIDLREQVSTTLLPATDGRKHQTCSDRRSQELHVFIHGSRGTLFLLAPKAGALRFVLEHGLPVSWIPVFQMTILANLV